MNYYCHFCNQRCHKTISTSRWWKCTSCNVEYKDDEDADHTDVILFKVVTPTHLFYLELNFTDNKTKVRVISKDEDGHYADEDYYKKPPIEVPYILKNVTPGNAEYKLKTLLTFS